MHRFLLEHTQMPEVFARLGQPWLNRKAEVLPFLQIKILEHRARTQP